MSTQGGWRKVIPAISGETKPYWDACRRGELLIQRCRQCNEYQFYPRGFCARCWSTDIAWVKSSGKGTVYTFSVTYQNRSPGYAEEVPYVLAVIELEEGVRMFNNVIHCNPRDVRIGMPVEVTFVKATDDVTVPYFQPARA